MPHDMSPDTSLAAYKDLCIDAADPHALSAFWGPLLGWESHPHDDGDSCLQVGEQVMVWFNQVPEPKTVKNRLHLDVNAGSLQPALDAGASLHDEQGGWTVLLDPDGQEFCVFERAAAVTQPFYELVWDVSGDEGAAFRLAQWWAEALGGSAVRDEGWSHVEGIAGLPCESIVFQPVTEEKTTKNRIHIDVTADAIGPLVAAGATSVRAKGDDGIGWTVMVDPAGNEFCAFTPD